MTSSPISIKRMPLVYIVVLNWNGWPDTIECLRSLEDQSYENYEVVVVDNGSTDDSVQRIRAAFPALKLLETGENLGFSAGNNVGIRYALSHDADFVWLLNNDTAVQSQTLAQMVDVATADSNVGAVGSVIMDMDDSARVQAWGGGTVRFWCGRSQNAKAPAKLDYLTAASLLVPHSVFDRVGLLDERYFLYWEDVDFSFRLRSAGYTLAVCEHAPVMHKGSTSLRDNKPLLDAYAFGSLVRFMLDHSPTPFLSIVMALGSKIAARLATFRFSSIVAICCVLRQTISQAEGRFK